ncbi:hypothetical protein [Jiella flava]|uniref:Uncharacterized protein n=1 Tax=Jiella flava TaxID=2816857 RepID=A0A939FZG9_9HYPH|nr:hypothetical protein [Jiella flava]MBO0662848.1 hypothetical protein [Jiella flava]
MSYNTIQTASGDGGRNNFTFAITAQPCLKLGRDTDQRLPKRHRSCHAQYPVIKAMVRSEVSGNFRFRQEHRPPIARRRIRYSRDQVGPAALFCPDALPPVEVFRRGRRSKAAIGILHRSNCAIRDTEAQAKRFIGRSGGHLLL